MKSLLLAIWDEFKALLLLVKNIILLRSLSPWNKNTGSVKSYNDANKKKGDSSRYGYPIADVKKSVSHKKSAEKKWSKPNKIEVGQFILAILTLVIGLFLARVYYFQMQANLRQAGASEEQLRGLRRQLDDSEAQQRALLKFGPITATITRTT